jgi:hypothetical protein
MKIEKELWQILSRLYFLERQTKAIVVGWSLEGILIAHAARKHQLAENIDKLVDGNYLTIKNTKLSRNNIYILTELGRETAKDNQLELNL